MVRDPWPLLNAPGPVAGWDRPARRAARRAARRTARDHPRHAAPGLAQVHERTLLRCNDLAHDEVRPDAAPGPCCAAATSGPRCTASEPRHPALDYGLAIIRPIIIIGHNRLTPDYHNRRHNAPGIIHASRHVVREPRTGAQGTLPPIRAMARPARLVSTHSRPPAQETTRRPSL